MLAVRTSLHLPSNNEKNFNLYQQIVSSLHEVLYYCRSASRISQDGSSMTPWTFTISSSSIKLVNIGVRFMVDWKDISISLLFTHIFQTFFTLRIGKIHILSKIEKLKCNQVINTFEQIPHNSKQFPSLMSFLANPSETWLWASFFLLFFMSCNFFSLYRTKKKSKMFCIVDIYICSTFCQKRWQIFLSKDPINNKNTYR